MMLKYKVSIDLSNDAFIKYAEHLGIARILRDLAEKLESSEGFDHVTRLRDINGNTVGSATWITED